MNQWKKTHKTKINLRSTVFDRYWYKTFFIIIFWAIPQTTRELLELILLSKIIGLMNFKYIFLPYKWTYFFIVAVQRIETKFTRITRFTFTELQKKKHLFLFVIKWHVKNIGTNRATSKWQQLVCELNILLTKPLLRWSIVV